MRISVSLFGGAALLTIGYVLGSSHVLSPAPLLAQAGAGGAAAGVDLQDETKTKIRTAADALKAASDALVDEGKYVPATKGVNSFAVLSGGVNAMQDLQSSAVVDPETFAGLYADLATDSIAIDLGRDAEGRLTYKNKVIRIYPLSRLRALYAVRADITGEELLPAAAEPDKSKPAKKPSAGGN